VNLGVPLGLSSGLFWGAADFFGGIQSRRLPALTVAFWSQAAGALALGVALVVLAAEGARPVAAGVAWGLAAGVGSGLALVLFYRGLAEGTMSVVAPVSACGAIVPVAAALLAGDRPGALAGAGVLAAVTGVVLVSRPRPPTRSEDPAPGGTAGPERQARPGRSGRVLAMALGAALGFGLFYVLVDAGTAAAAGAAGTSGSRGSPLWVIAGARASSLMMLSMIALIGRRSARSDRSAHPPGSAAPPGSVRSARSARSARPARSDSSAHRAGSALRWPGRRIGPVALVGVGDTAANLLFAYAATSGNLAVVGVLGSLYPVATVVLARWLLGERLSGGQNAGVVLALTGVGLLAAA
jgi:drug/metabolite transporter (DMT)-like permease